MLSVDRSALGCLKDRRFGGGKEGAIGGEDGSDQMPVDGGRILAQRLTHPDKLNHVQSAFARLDPPHERVFPGKFPGQIALRHAGLFAHLDQLGEYVSVGRTVDGLEHVQSYTTALCLTAKCVRKLIDRILRAVYTSNKFWESSVLCGANAVLICQQAARTAERNQDRATRITPTSNHGAFSGWLFSKWHSWG